MKIFLTWFLAIVIAIALSVGTYMASFLWMNGIWLITLLIVLLAAACFLTDYFYEL